MVTETKYVISFDFAGPCAHWNKKTKLWEARWGMSLYATLFDTHDEAASAAIHVQRQFPDRVISVIGVSVPAKKKSLLERFRRKLRAWLS